MRALRQAAEGLAVVGLATGTLATALPPLARPVFLRLASEETDVVDRARATYLGLAAADLRACRPAWSGGPGVAVDPSQVDRACLAAEIHALGRALRVLGDETIARSYLELVQPASPADAVTEGEST